MLTSAFKAFGFQLGNIVGQERVEISDGVVVTCFSYFQVRYFPNNNHLLEKLGHNSSYVWRSILRA